MKTKPFKLSPSQREELSQYLDYTDDELDFLEERLNKSRWYFASKAARLRISIDSQLDHVLPSGKVIAGKQINVQFQMNGNRPDHGGSFETKDRDLARGIYTSDSFRRGRCWDIEEKASADFENRYQNFKQEVMADPERLERLRQELEAV